jgi:hypothetical protein
METIAHPASFRQCRRLGSMWHGYRVDISSGVQEYVIVLCHKHTTCDRRMPPKALLSVTNLVVSSCVVQVCDLEDVAVADIAAGGWHSMALTADGQIYVWGRCELGNQMLRPLHRECSSPDASHCSVLHCTVLYRTVLHCTVLYCTVLYCTVPYCAALYCTVRC